MGILMLYEVMTVFQANGFRVRVWSKTVRFTMGPDRRVLELLNIHNTVFSMMICDILKGKEFISAFEIVSTKTNEGCVTYNEWP